MVIVTQNQYVLATKIHAVTLSEDHEWVDLTVNGKRTNVKEYKYVLSIIYTPDLTGQNTNHKDETKECSVTLRGKVNAYKVYKDLVSQIREQMPDTLFLHQAIENLLKQEDLVQIQSEDDECKKQEEKTYDAIAAAIRGIRKTKRKRKKVLRRPKSRR
jgi:hypothetical protein